MLRTKQSQYHDIEANTLEIYITFLSPNTTDAKGWKVPKRERRLQKEDEQTDYVQRRTRGKATSSGHGRSAESLPRIENKQEERQRYLKRFLKEAGGSKNGGGGGGAKNEPATKNGGEADVTPLESYPGEADLKTLIFG